MTLPVVFHEAAERELGDAAAYYYAQERPGLGEGIRRWRLRRFPCAVIYRIRPDHIRILAIAAHKRRPGYWHGRG